MCRIKNTGCINVVWNATTSLEINVKLDDIECFWEKQKIYLEKMEVYPKETCKQNDMTPR